MNTRIIIFVFVVALALSAGVASGWSNLGSGDWNNIRALSTGELLVGIKDYVVENGERRSNTTSKLDFVSKNKYYYIYVMDYENDGIMDRLLLSVVRGNVDLTDKWNDGDIDKNFQLVPGGDPSILESKHFCDEDIDGRPEVYQFLSVLDYNNPAASDYDKGLINEKIVDESPNSINDPKINRDFRGLVLEVYEKLIITSTLTSSPTPPQLDTDGDGWSDDKENLMGTNPYSVDSDNDGINDPQDPNPTVPESKVPGFEAAIAIAGLLAVAYLLRRRK